MVGAQHPLGTAREKRLRLSVGFDGDRLQGDDAGNYRLVDRTNALASSADPKAFGEINWLAKYDKRAAEDAARQPAPHSPGFGSALAENPFDALMVHGDDGYRGLSVSDRISRAIPDHGKVITASALIEDEQIVALQKIYVLAHEPRMIAPFDRDCAQESEQGLGELVTKEILPGGEIHEGEGRVKNVLRKIGSHGDEKRIVHGGMIRNEEHPFPASGNIVASAHAGKIEGEAEKQKGDEADGNHGNVGCPDPQTREYSCNQHDVYSLRRRVMTPAADAPPGADPRHHFRIPANPSSFPGTFVALRFTFCATLRIA